MVRTTHLTKNNERRCKFRCNSGRVGVLGKVCKNRQLFKQKSSYGQIGSGKLAKLILSPAKYRHNLLFFGHEDHFSVAFNVY